jgi:hypothetical protein
MPKTTNAQWRCKPVVWRARRFAAWKLRQRGFSFKVIATVLEIGPERARAIVAKCERLTACDCPANYDHTMMGHLPACPATGGAL